MKEKRSRAILYLENNRMVLIHRIKPDRDYYVFPGGGLEPGETELDALVREGREELGVTLEPVKLLYELESAKDIQYFFLCGIKEGVIGTGKGPEFSSIEYANKGQYIIEKINLENISNYEVFPKIIRDQLNKDILQTRCIFHIWFKKLYEISY